MTASSRVSARPLPAPRPPPQGPRRLTCLPRPAPLAAMGLPVDDFRARFGLMSLHLWMVLVRLRSEGPRGQALGQELYDHYWAEMEALVRSQGVVVRLSKWMKELEQVPPPRSRPRDEARPSTLCVRGHFSLHGAK